MSRFAADFPFLSIQYNEHYTQSALTRIFFTDNTVVDVVVVVTVDVVGSISIFIGSPFALFYYLFLLLVDIW